jgi:hypothetical protein
MNSTHSISCLLQKRADHIKPFLSFFDFSLVLCRVLSSGKVRGKDNFWTGLVFVASHENRQISRSAGGVTTGRGTPQ